MESNIYDEGYYNGNGVSNYKSYEDEPKFELWADEIIRLFDCKNRKLKVLDVACAKGFLVQHLRANSIEAEGVDISEYAIGAAPDAVKPFLKVGSVLKLPYKDNEFDVVTSHDFLEHIAHEDTPQAIAELLRVGKKQYHVIGCIEYDFGGDKTHINLKPFTYWEDMFPKIIIRRCDENITKF